MENNSPTRSGRWSVQTILYGKERVEGKSLLSASTIYLPPVNARRFLLVRVLLILFRESETHRRTNTLSHIRRARASREAKNEIIGSRPYNARFLDKGRVALVSCFLAFTGRRNCIILVAVPFLYFWQRCAWWISHAYNNCNFITEEPNLN